MKINKLKKTTIAYVLAGFLATSNAYYIIDSNSKEDELNNILKKYNVLEKEIKELRETTKKQKEKIDYYNSDKYIESIKLSKLEELTDLDISSYYKEEFIFTYYTSLPEENGGYTITCNGEQLSDGMVASNYYPQGTKLYIDGKLYIVRDRGSSRFNSENRLDVFVPRYYGESDNSYFSRVNNMGVKRTSGYVISEE